MLKKEVNESHDNCGNVLLGGVLECVIFKGKCDALVSFRLPDVGHS